MHVRGEPVTVGRIVQLTSNPMIQIDSLLADENRKLVKEKGELIKLLKWALSELADFGVDVNDAEEWVRACELIGLEHNKN